MKKITEFNNFCRVFELPESYPEGFCFGGGKPIGMIMVDWFNPVQLDERRPGVPSNWEEAKEMIPPFIRQKTYFKKGKKYLVLTDFDEALVVV